jgi:hypothetical protein
MSLPLAIQHPGPSAAAPRLQNGIGSCAAQPAQEITQRSFDDLLALRARIRTRKYTTTLAEIRAEVGDAVYAEIERRSSDRPVVMRRGEVVGLPPGTYMILLREALRRRREMAKLGSPQNIHR